MRYTIMIWVLFWSFGALSYHYLGNISGVAGFGAIAFIPSIALLIVTWDSSKKQMPGSYTNQSKHLFWLTYSTRIMTMVIMLFTLIWGIELPEENTSDSTLKYIILETFILLISYLAVATYLEIFYGPKDKK